MSHKYDVYMFGCILYEMLTFSKYKLDMYNDRLHDTGVFTDLLDLCVNRMPDSRPTHVTIFEIVRKIVLEDINKNKDLDDERIMAYLPFFEEEIGATKWTQMIEQSASKSASKKDKSKQ